MKKKIIALIMIIPIVFLIALFSVGKAAGVYADIPVTGIQITTQNEDGFIDVDVADYDPIAFLAQVQPVNARNQKYSLEISGVGGDEAPEGFKIIDGKLYIENVVGKVKITAISAEKGFKDSVIVSAYSTKVLRIYPKVNGEKIASDVVSIDGGENVFSAELYPENLSGETRIFEEIGGNHILKLNAVTGVAQALFSGETQVRITCPEGREGLEKVLTVNVNVDTDSTGFAVNGKSSGAKVTVKNNATAAKLFVESKNDALEISDLTLPEGVTASGIERISENKFVLTLSFDKEFSDEAISGKVGATDFSLEFTEYNLDVRTSYYDGEGDEIKQKNNTKVTYVAYSESDDDADVTFEIIDGADVITLEQHGQFATITATKRGDAKIKITAKHDGKSFYVEKTIRVVPNVYSMEFADSAKEYGIENILTIGGKNHKGRQDARTIFVRVVTEAGAETFTDEFMNVAFSDDNSLFSCKAQTATNADAVSAEIRATGTGLTTLNAELKNYNQYFGTNICAKIRLRAVKEGRNVGNYEELKTVTEAGHIVVLTSDVMLGVKNDGTAMTEDELKKDVKKFITTYDKTYLENSGENKYVQYLIEFKKDVYGNGFEINADKFTQCKDATGLPKIFKGPLNFVAISSASVKGQDNVSFLVRTDDVLINNVVLKGCSDDSLLEEDGQFNLSQLNYVGTTLEIAKSAKLLNSRVSNGRTVVRIFAGGSTMGSPVVEDESAFNVQDEKINVHIESCVLSNAREFILKIGSNRALKQKDEVQRKLRKEKDNEYYSPYDESNKTDKYFNDNYLINDVTLKNSVLETSGLFSVGMETHFSGEFLLGDTITTWKDCAATSYASALRIVGDVKMLDWKNLSNVDSSTLIEVTGDANDWLSMNVAEMMKEVAKVDKKCRDIILNVGGTEYVHGGIAFYGGGYNYSYLDLTEANDETKQFGVYDVNISVLENSKDENIRNQGKMLPLAAGAGDFRFYLYNNKSSRNLSWQESIKNQGNQGMKIHPVVAEDVE